MKITSPLALAAIGLSAVAPALFAQTISNPTATVGAPTVTVNGTAVTVQFPVSVSLNMSSLSTGTTAASGTTATSSTGTTSTASTGTTSTTTPVASTAAVSPTVITTGLNGALNGFQPVVNSLLYKDISTASVDPFSSTFMSMYGAAHLNADFTMPYYVVNDAPRMLISNVATASESDVVAVPITTSTPVENGLAGCTDDGMDHHAFIIDAATGFDYEIYQAQNCNGVWSTYSTTLWDLTKTEQRPIGWTSADAAGLPIFPLLVRYDEVANGVINHALRVTFSHTKTGANGGIFVAPATHAAGDIWGTAAYTGMKIRLKSSFDISGFSKTNQIILTAMKKYGMIVADNGSSGMFQGTADSRWDVNDLANLNNVAISNFDVVQMGTQTAENAVPTGSAPVVSSFTATQSGSSTVLMWSASGASYNYIAEFGPVRGTSVTVPYLSGATYTLVSSNQYGRTTKTVTVK